MKIKAKHWQKWYRALEWSMQREALSTDIQAHKEALLAFFTLESTGKQILLSSSDAQALFDAALNGKMWWGQQLVSWAEDWKLGTLPWCDVIDTVLHYNMVKDEISAIVGLHEKAQYEVALDGTVLMAPIYVIMYPDKQNEIIQLADSAYPQLAVSLSN
jgi:hypothetical protein